MTWMQYGTSAYDIGDDKIEGVTVRDIANSLAKLNRFTGHSSEPYSVARHSLFVSRLLDINPLSALYGLVHDVAETVVQDISWPMKQMLSKRTREELDILEEFAERALFKVLGVDWPMPPDIEAAVKRADWVAVATEKRDLLPECARTWNMLKEPASHLTAGPTLRWRDDAAQWMERYLVLTRHLGIKPGV